MKKLTKQQLNLSIPSAFECIISTLISMVDIFAISFLGSTVIAAVGAMLAIINFLNLVIKSIQVSNNVIIARHIGENNLFKVEISTGNAVFLTILLQTICIIITVIFSPYLPKIFKVDKICLIYLYIRLVGIIPAAITTIISGHERTNRKSKEMLWIRFFSLILNIILDYLAIKLNFGISGVAWATVIIEVINMIIVLVLSKNTIIYKINKNAIFEILKLAKHGILDRIFDRGGKLVLDIILSRIGTFEYAAHVILNQIELFANDFCYGFGIGITTNIGIKLGKNNKEDLLNLKQIINKLINALTIIIPGIILIVSIILLPILLKESETLRISYKLLPLVVIYSILMPIRYKYSSIIEGMKEFKFNAQVSLIVNIIKIVLAYFLSMYFSINGIWVTFIISYVIIIVILKKKINISTIFNKNCK